MTVFLAKLIILNMENFTVSPEDCLILKAFRDSNSLREAAILLQCDPAGLARKVQHISSKYGFLQKINNRWRVTARGLDLVAWTEDSIQSQKKILLEKSSLRLAATMWFSEEFIIPNLQFLRKSLDESATLSLNVPSKDFETVLLDGSADYAITCHVPVSPEIEHRQITDEFWTIVTPPSWEKDFQKCSNVFEILDQRPFVTNSSLNPDLFLPDLKNIVKCGVTADNLIGIRGLVAHGMGWSLVPKILVKRFIQEKKLFEVNYKPLSPNKKICLLWLRNRYDNKRLAPKITSWINETAKLF